VLFCLYRRRQRRREISALEKNASYPGVPELENLEKREVSSSSAGSSRPAELSGSRIVHASELDASPVHELGGSDGRIRVKEAVELDVKVLPMTARASVKNSSTDVPSNRPECPMNTASRCPNAQDVYKVCRIISAMGTETPEELARLAEEERILDQEIMETERLRELLSRRREVQKRIAKGK
jgi:hypothetical protein